MSRKGIALAAFMAITGTAGPVHAQTATALKTGERVTGLTKQCYYEFAGTGYTTTVQSFNLCPLSIKVRLAPAASRETAPSAAAATAFKTGEETTGLTKQCYYAFGASRYTKTVQATELCPLSIRVPF